MMFDENFEVVAVMDWEQPSLGGALHDLAWWLYNSDTMHSGKYPERPYLDGMGSRAETIALWRELTGIPTDDIDWYEEFTALKYSCTGIRVSTLRGLPLPDETWLAQRLKVA
jgi:aminoglycoside phosphotransferase (APT) family kinase protein